MATDHPRSFHDKPCGYGMTLKKKKCRGNNFQQQKNIICVLQDACNTHIMQIACICVFVCSVNNRFVFFFIVLHIMDPLRSSRQDATSFQSFAMSWHVRRVMNVSSFRHVGAHMVRSYMQGKNTGGRGVCVMWRDYKGTEGRMYGGERELEEERGGRGRMAQVLGQPSKDAVIGAHSKSAGEI